MESKSATQQVEGLGILRRGEEYEGDCDGRKANIYFVDREWRGAEMEKPMMTNSTYHILEQALQIAVDKALEPISLGS